MHKKDTFNSVSRLIDKVSVLVYNCSVYCRMAESEIDFYE